jgi:tetratricopeptide (TPR) repeat protein
MQMQKYPKAYEAYQQAVYRDGRNPTFWCSIGVLYYQINQYRDALDAYSRAIRLNPWISEVWYDLGTLVSFWLCTTCLSFTVLLTPTFLSTSRVTTRSPMPWTPTSAPPSWTPAIPTSRPVCSCCGTVKPTALPRARRPCPLMSIRRLTKLLVQLDLQGHNGPGPAPERRRNHRSRCSTVGHKALAPTPGEGESPTSTPPRSHGILTPLSGSLSVAKGRPVSGRRALSQSSK